MNLILLRPDDLDGACAMLRDRRADHIRTVHRAQVGDRLLVGVENGALGTGEVRSIDADAVCLEITLDRDPPSPPGVDLLLALPRPKMLRRVLAASASMGVKRIVLVNAARVEKSYFDTPHLRPEKVLEQLRLGLEQGRDTVLPEVLVRARFRPFVEDELPELWHAAERLIAHPGVERFPEACDVGDASRRAVVAIGPEGGWVPFELGLLENAGFQPFSMGAHILRVDTAVPAVLAQLMLLRRQNGSASV